MPLDMGIAEKEPLHLPELQKREIEVIYPDSDGEPMAEYLDERLLGFQVQGKEYIPIEPNEGEEPVSEEPGVALGAKGELIQVIDPRTDAPVPELEEAIERAEAAEAELARLREILAHTAQEFS